jgi:hypothetical protein
MIFDVAASAAFKPCSFPSMENTDEKHLESVSG